MLLKKLKTSVFSFLHSINDYESCAEMLLDTLGEEIVNLCDKKDRYVNVKCCITFVVLEVVSLKNMVKYRKTVILGDVIK